MKCPTCGTELGPGDRYCPVCGAAQPAAGAAAPAAGPAAQPFAAPAAPAAPNVPPIEVDRNLSKGLFYSTLATDKVRKNIRNSAIVCYVCAALTGVVALLTSVTMLLDVIIILVLGLLVHLKQSRVCAVLLLAYSIINTVITLLSTGSPGGWLLIIAGVYAVKSTFALEKEYQAFRAGK